jgi:hypothetical protein
MEARARTYNKYVVKTSVGGKEKLKNEDGSPKLGDLVKTNVRITPEQAETLNHGWDSTEHRLTYYYVEVKNEVQQDNEIPDKDKRKQLFAEAEEMGLDVPKNIKTDKLEERIANHKG